MVRYFFLLSFLLAGVCVAQAQTGKKPSAKPPSVPLTMMQDGKRVYENACLVCHQADGNGVPRMNPPLAKTDWVTGDKARLIQVVLKGLDKEIEVNGETYYNPMPAQAHLTDKEIADVLTYIRNSFGNKASVVTAAEVKAQRARLQK